MTREEKNIRRDTIRSERRAKNIKRSINRKQAKIADLLNCPFDVEMNNRYGTCTCGGENRSSCAMET